jgi:hypothetical protein
MTATATDLLYLLCSLALVVSAGFVVLGGRHNQGAADAEDAAPQWFALSAMSLLAWVGTLYVFDRYQLFRLSANEVLLIGRANFASVAVAVYFALRFVLSLASKSAHDAPMSMTLLRLLLWESVLLGLISIGTAFVGESETITAGTGADGSAVFLPRPATTYGTLFPLYVLHVVAYLAAAVSLALSARTEALRPRRDQLGLVALGMIATGSIALLTNAVLPYFLETSGIPTWALYPHFCSSSRWAGR